MSNYKEKEQMSCPYVLIYKTLKYSEILYFFLTGEKVPRISQQPIHAKKKKKKVHLHS